MAFHVLIPKNLTTGGDGIFKWLYCRVGQRYTSSSKPDIEYASVEEK